MEVIWKFTSIVILVVFFINIFWSGYYGNKTAETILDRLVSGITKLGIILGLYGAFVLIIYYFASTVTQRFDYNVVKYDSFHFSESDDIFVPDMKTYTRTYGANAAFLLVCLVPLVLIGSICYAIFAGAGMALYPITLILSYFNQPTKPSAEEYVLSKKVLIASSEMLLNKAREAYDLRHDLDLNPVTNPVEKKMKLQVLNDKVKEMKYDLADYEEVFLVFKQQDNILEVNPLVYLGNLIMGIVFGLISVLFFAHTFLSVRGFYVILESFFGFLEGLTSLIALFVFLIISIYLGIAINKAAVKLSGMLGALLDTGPFKLNGTWTDTFLLNNNILLFSFIGMIVYFMMNCPTYFRFLAAQLIFGRIITKISFVNGIYRFQITDYLFIGFFIIGIILCLFSKSGKAILDEKVKEKQMQLEAEKERLAELEKNKDKKPEESK